MRTAERNFHHDQSQQAKSFSGRIERDFSSAHARLLLDERRQQLGRRGFASATGEGRKRNRFWIRSDAGVRFAGQRLLRLHRGFLWRWERYQWNGNGGREIERRREDLSERDLLFIGKRHEPLQRQANDHG